MPLIYLSSSIKSHIFHPSYQVLSINLAVACIVLEAEVWDKENCLNCQSLYFDF